MQRIEGLDNIAEEMHLCNSNFNKSTYYMSKSKILLTIKFIYKLFLII